MRILGALVLAVVSTSCFSAESLRWLAGPGTVAGQAVVAGAPAAPGELLAVGGAPALIDLGRAMDGLLTLGTGAQGVVSVDGTDLIIRIVVGRAQVRIGAPGTCTRVRVRTDRAEVRLAVGLVLGDATGPLVVVEGNGEARGLGPDGRGGPWKPVAARQVLVPGEEPGEAILRPQLADPPLAEQAVGRRPPPPAAVTGLDAWRRDDAAVAAVTSLLATDPPAGRNALRAVARRESAAALLILQIAIGEDSSLAESLAAELAAADPALAPLAAVAAVLVAPARREAITAAVLQVAPGRRAAVLERLASTFPPPVPAK